MSAGLTVAVIATASVLVDSRRESRPTSRSVQHVRFDQSASSADEASEREHKRATPTTMESSMSVDRLISIRNTEIEDADRELARLDSQIDRLRTRRSTAETDNTNLPGVVHGLNAKQRLLELEIQKSRRSLADAQKQLATFQESVPLRFDREQQRSDSLRQTELTNEADRLESERKEREERRARLGAQSSGQEEALYARQQKRLTQQRANQKYANNLAQETSRIAAVTSTLKGAIAAADANLKRLEQDRVGNDQALEVAVRALADSGTVLESVPPELASLELKRDQVRQRRSTLDASRQIALKEQQRLKAELAQIQAKEQREAEKSAKAIADQKVAQSRIRPNAAPSSFNTTRLAPYMYQSTAFTEDAYFSEPEFTSRRSKPDSSSEYQSPGDDSLDQPARWSPKVGVAHSIGRSGSSGLFMSDGSYGVAQQRPDGGHNYFAPNGFSAFSVSGGSSGNAVHFDAFGNVSGISQTTPYGINYFGR